MEYVRTSPSSLYFFSLKQSKSEYEVRNVPTQFHISLHNGIYSINGVIYFLFVHHSIMEQEMEQDWIIFTPYSLLLYFRGKNEVLHWKCSKRKKFINWFLKIGARKQSLSIKIKKNKARNLLRFFYTHILLFSKFLPTFFFCHLVD